MDSTTGSVEEFDDTHDGRRTASEDISTVSIVLLIGEGKLRPVVANRSINVAIIDVEERTFPIVLNNCGPNEAYWYKHSRVWTTAKSSEMGIYRLTITSIESIKQMPVAFFARFQWEMISEGSADPKSIFLSEFFVCRQSLGIFVEHVDLNRRNHPPSPSGQTPEFFSNWNPRKSMSSNLLLN